MPRQNWGISLRLTISTREAVRSQYRQRPYESVQKRVDEGMLASSLARCAHRASSTSPICAGWRSAGCPRLVFDYIDGGAEDEITLRDNVARVSRDSLPAAPRRRGTRVRPAHDGPRHDVRAAVPARARRLLPHVLSARRSGGGPRRERRGHRASSCPRFPGRGSRKSASRPAARSGISSTCPAAARSRRRASRARVRPATRCSSSRSIRRCPACASATTETASGPLLAADWRRSLPHLWQFVTHPRWVLDYLADGSPRVFPNVELPGIGAMPCSDVGALLASTVITWSDFQWIRDAWKGPVVAKGVHTGEDARRAIDAGADAIVVSNHGGRQLDGVPGSLRALPEVLAAVNGRVEVMVDGGVRRGGDVVKALCLGARAVLVGRAYAWGLGAAGGPGVDRAIEILRADIDRTMRLLGCASISELSREYVESGKVESAKVEKYETKPSSRSVVFAVRRHERGGPGPRDHERPGRRRQRYRDQSGDHRRAGRADLDGLARAGRAGRRRPFRRPVKR